MTTANYVQLDPERVERLTQEQRDKFHGKTPKSGELFDRAKKALTGGVPSSYQMRKPWPIYLTHGKGSHLFDVDGNEYADFHSGFGALIVGHAHPKVVEAVSRAISLGSHFAAPTEDGVIVAEILAKNYGIPQWRFTNSGTESTRDAIHVARAIRGYDHIIKMESSYHGHHDAVMVSVAPDLDLAGPRERPNSVPYQAGLPKAMTDLTLVVPFNDADLLEARIAEMDGKVACVLMEAAMMNIGVVLPLEGYLQRVREICDRWGVILIFDEVKTNTTAGPGGATGYFGVKPDMVTLGKCFGGGLPVGAVGMSEAIAQHVVDGHPPMVGTFNGNPVCMAAARATLQDIMTPAAYAELDRLTDRLRKGCEEIINKYEFGAHVVTLGAKGAVTFAPTALVDYRDFKARVDFAVEELAWLYHMNNGIWMTPGVDEEWTLSVQHTDEDVDRYIAAFAEMAEDLTR